MRRDSRVDATDNQLQRALHQAIETAWRSYRDGLKDANGHHRAGARVIGGLRISVRINRHQRTEISLVRPDGSDLDGDTIERIVKAHTAVQGSRLKIAYTEPRDAFARSPHCHWVVLHVAEENSQPALLPTK